MVFFRNKSIEKCIINQSSPFIRRENAKNVITHCSLFTMSFFDW